MLFGSTRELSSTWSVGQFDYGATPIQMSNFSCTEPNAYITNTLNKLFFTQSSAESFFCHAYTACFDLLEINGGKSGKICFPLASRTRNILA